MSSNLKGTRVVLVRHGQSTYNALGLYQGSSDRSLLTEEGYNEARQTGEFLKGLKFEAIYSSSLQRSQATAKEIFKVISPQADPDTINFTYQLRETDLPAWEGLAFQYVRENFSQDYRYWKIRPHEFCMVGKTHQSIHPALDLYKRVREFWLEVLPRHVGQTLLIVAHGGTNRALISTALGIAPERYHCIQQSNCGISVLHFPDGSLASGSLEVMNLTTPVGECLPLLQESGLSLRLLLLPVETSDRNQTQLAQLLQATNINFSTIEDDSQCQAIAKNLLRHHPETNQLRVLDKNFSKWSQGVNAGNTATSFLTDLIIGKTNTIKHLLSKALGINSISLRQLQLISGTVSCLHYPGNEHPPILQVMNLPAFPTKSILDLETIKNQKVFDFSTVNLP